MGLESRSIANPNGKSDTNTEFQAIFDYNWWSEMLEMVFNLWLGAVVFTQFRASLLGALLNTGNSQEMSYAVLIFISTHH